MDLTHYSIHFYYIFDVNFFMYTFFSMKIEVYINLLIDVEKET